MSDNSTTVNFNLRTAGFAEYANQTLTFRLLTAGATGSNDFVVLPSVVTATSDANGDGSVVLFRNGVSDIESVHEVIFPNREKAQFIIPSGTSTVELSNLLVNSQPSGSSVQQSSVYAQAIQRANHTGTQLLSTISDATEGVQDIVGGMVTGNTETGITVTYEDSDGTLDFVVASQTDQNFTTALKDKLDGIAGSTTEEIQDIAGALVATGGTKTGIAVTYDDANNNMDFVVASQTDENFTTADHAKLDSLDATAVSNFVSRSISFTNNSAFLSVAENDILDVGTGDFSLSFWARLDASDTQPVLQKNGTSGFALSFISGALNLTLNASGSSNFPLTSSLNDNKWHCYVVTVDRDGNAIAYVDNVAQTGVVVSGKGGNLDNSADFLIGLVGTDAGDNIALGNYVALHKQILTASQAAQIFFSADAALTAVAPALMVDLREADKTFTDVSTNGFAVTTNGIIIFNEGRLTEFTGTNVLATSTLGYTTGSGGTQTQETSKSTTVILNKATGQITLHGAALGANTNVAFALTNSTIAANDILVFNHVSGGTIGAYNFNAVAGSGTATVTVRNITGSSLTETPVISFAVIKAVTS